LQALVTGAGGFIGSHLCRELRNKGTDIRVLALPGERVDHLEKLGVETRFGDLTDRSSIRGISDGIDVVYHLAGRVTDWGARKLFYSAIFDATRNLLEACAGKAPRFVYVSSVNACGTGRHLKGQKEDDPVYKTGVPYGDAKLDTERLVWDYQREKKLVATVVRPTNVIGPRSVWVTEIVGRFVKSSVPLVDGGRHSASLLYVDNLVDGLVLAGTMDVAKGRTYHFRDDWEVPWRQYISDLGVIVGKKPSFSLPYRLAWMLGSIQDRTLTPLGIRPSITRHAVAITGRNLDLDTSRARTELGWRSKVSYEAAMQRIKEWVLTEFLPSVR